MALILKQTDSYVWPVTVELPVDGGRFEKHSFDAEFKRLSQSRIEEIMEDVVKGDAKDREVAAEILIGWRGVSDDSGDIPFSEKARDDLLNIPLVSASTIKAWMESLAGAKRKN